MPDIKIGDRTITLSPRTIVGIVIGVAALIFIFQNSREAHVDVLAWQVDRPLWLFLLLVFAAGFVVGSLFPWFHRREKRGRDDSATGDGAT